METNETRDIQGPRKTLSLEKSQHIISATLSGENVENKESRQATKQALVNTLRMLDYDEDWLTSFIIFLDAMDCYLFESTYEPAPIRHPNLEAELDLEYIPMEVFLGQEPEYESLPVYEPETAPKVAPMPQPPFVLNAVPKVAPIPEPTTRPTMAEVAKVTATSSEPDFEIEHATSEQPLSRLVASYGPTTEGPISVEDELLFNHLRDLRAQIAEENEVELYMVFNNATLEEMARKRPQTEQEMLDIKGVGPKKLEWYGDEFMSAIADFEQEYEN